MRVYGRWGGDPKGRPEDITRCVEEVGFGERGGVGVGRQCDRKRGFGPTKEHCKQHDPDRLRARREAQQAAWDRKEKWGDLCGDVAMKLTARLGVEVRADYNWNARAYSGRMVVDAAYLTAILRQLDARQIERLAREGRREDSMDASADWLLGPGRSA